MREDEAEIEGEDEGRTTGAGGTTGAESGGSTTGAGGTTGRDFEEKYGDGSSNKAAGDDKEEGKK